VTDKPRYRGTFKNGVFDLEAVDQVVGEAQAAADHPRNHAGAPSTSSKPRYRGQFSRGQLRIRPTTAPTPGRLSQVESAVLRGLGNQERGGQVPLTYFPTRTSDPADPRTAAAGYDATTRTMRVAWGDGGADYNYYEVTPQEWQRFKRSASPGKLINRVFNYHPYGRS
jgi:hypothetical protein